MPRQLALLCVAVAFAVTIRAAETTGIDFDAVDDPLAEAPDFLPADQAFVVTSGLRGGEGGAEEIIVRWDMPAGYYLYRHRFGVSADQGLTLGDPTLPRGEMRTDEYFGESEVYLGSVEVVVPVLKRTVKTATVRFAYQGCAERGLCYPPVEHEVVFHFGQVDPVPVRWRFGVLIAGAALLLAVLWTVRAMRRRDVR